MKHKYFTLIELLVVIAIIGVLTSLILPAVAETKRKARSIMCMNVLKQYGLGHAMYDNETDGQFPSWPSVNSSGTYETYTSVADGITTGIDTQIYLAGFYLATKDYYSIAGSWYKDLKLVDSEPNIADLRNKYIQSDLTCPFNIMYYESGDYDKISNTNLKNSMRPARNGSYEHAAFQNWDQHPQSRFFAAGGRKNSQLTTKPSQYYIMNDRGYDHLDSDSEEFYFKTHSNGWNVLFLDGHVSFENERNPNTVFGNYKNGFLSSLEELPAGW
ncbi:MAG: prepilin-type N-terminal cleavage/methylation domain-containing protein [Lentisphaeria bacterium]|nr:prepilin-type N-terminal cleavage/methylation domain-containing protein [Lentisphaeria bacterium]